MIDNREKTIGDHWDAAAHRTNRRRNWRDFPVILEWLHKRVCGEPIKGPGAAGLNYVFKQRLNGRVLKRGVSIGGGSGLREIQLIMGGYVEEMVVYDLSPARIEIGRNFARTYRVADKIHFHCADGMASLEEKYDLVFWHAALHHMFDTPKAVEWSWNALNPGGFFWAVEYTGPSKAIYTPEMLAWATAIRRMFPAKYTQKTEKWRVPVHIPVPPPNPSRADPSEAADSERIMPTVHRVMPNAEIWPLGGVGYLVAFNPMSPRFDPASEEDNDWIRAMMAIDDHLSDNGINLKHAILGQKT